MDSHPQCNRCWREFEQGQHAFITSCSHIFCANCADSLTSSGACPLCDTPLSQRSIATNVLAQTSDKLVQLCGLTPNEILNLCTKSLSFWTYQQVAIIARLREERRQDTQRFQQLESAFAEKINEAQNRLETLKKRYDLLNSELEQARGETSEAQSKYIEIARQKRKLEELYESAKRHRGNGTTSPLLSIESSQSRPSVHHSPLAESQMSQTHSNSLTHSSTHLHHFSFNNLLPNPQQHNTSNPNLSLIPSRQTQPSPFLTPSGTPLRANPPKSLSRPSYRTFSSATTSPRSFQSVQTQQPQSQTPPRSASTKVLPSPKFFSFRQQQSSSAPTKGTYYYRR